MKKDLRIMLVADVVWTLAIALTIAFAPEPRIFRLISLLLMSIVILLGRYEADEDFTAPYSIILYICITVLISTAALYSFKIVPYLPLAIITGANLVVLFVSSTIHIIKIKRRQTHKPD